MAKQFSFFMNDKQFFSGSVLPTLAGWQIRELTKIPGDYSLRLYQEHSPHHDLLVGDNNAVNLDVSPVPRLWAVPHSTM